MSKKPAGKLLRRWEMQPEIHQDLSNWVTVHQNDNGNNDNDSYGIIFGFGVSPC